jgi:ABC-type transporter Mla subunit MlaD
MSTPRRNRTHPCFSDSEWADLTTAANACRIKPGGYAAATALLAARSPDPRASIADARRKLEELMESNRQLAAVGNNLNQVLLHLRPGDPLHAQADSALRLTRAALDDVDAAAAEIAW